MKRCIVSLCVVAAALISSGQELSDSLTKLKESLSSRVRIGTVNDTTLRESDKKFEVLKLGTNQDPRQKDLNFRMKVTVELTDKAENTCWAQINREQGSVDKEYTGEDVWEFRVPHGEMEKPKVTAYAVQYGIFKDGVFIPVAEKFSKVDTVEEITSKSANRVDFSQTLHYYSYNNSDGEKVSSSPN